VLGPCGYHEVGVECAGAQDDHDVGGLCAGDHDGRSGALNARQSQHFVTRGIALDHQPTAGAHVRCALGFGIDHHPSQALGIQLLDYGTPDPPVAAHDDVVSQGFDSALHALPPDVSPKGLRDDQLGRPA
jgi:hypothetical protein